MKNIKKIFKDSQTLFLTISTIMALVISIIVEYQYKSYLLGFVSGLISIVIIYLISIPFAKKKKSK